MAGDLGVQRCGTDADGMFELWEGTCIPEWDVLGSLVQPSQAMLLGWYVNKSKKEQEIATEKEESDQPAWLIFLEGTSISQPPAVHWLFPNPCWFISALFESEMMSESRWKQTVIIQNDPE